MNTVMMIPAETLSMIGMESSQQIAELIETLRKLREENAKLRAENAELHQRNAAASEGAENEHCA